jgi:hypothetical protein
VGAADDTLFLRLLCCVLLRHVCGAEGHATMKTLKALVNKQG